MTLTTASQTKKGSDTAKDRCLDLPYSDHILSVQKNKMNKSVYSCVEWSLDYLGYTYGCYERYKLKIHSKCYLQGMEVEILKL